MLLPTAIFDRFRTPPPAQLATATEWFARTLRNSPALLTGTSPLNLRMETKPPRRSSECFSLSHVLLGAWGLGRAAAERGGCSPIPYGSKIRFEHPAW